ncbi:hypothetical protein AN641_03160 [Candidatus Epulonipiscioides gigas]|nr:hypothetical protein AN641_03160 [Epulopiscium sp. SCG-C07WGA-EpuloA2]
MNTILIIEDDKILSDGIKIALENTKDKQIYQATTIEKGKKILNKYKIDLIILDINLPDGNGLDLLEEIKNVNKHILVIMLTVNDLETDVVTGLENGADDYITKPFSLAILRARVNTQLKRISVFIQNDFNFNFEKMEFYVQNQKIELSKIEQKVLKLLIDNKGLILKRKYLINKIWDYENMDANTLSVLIKRLRTKLNNDNCIQTIYGIGYMWVN